MSITYVLSLFSLLAVSSGTFFLAQRLRIPYTVLLVAVGTFLLVPLSRIAPLSFIDDFTLTPELLFYIFLPVLIFEAAYNIDIRRLIENARAISLLAVVGLLISAGFIAVVLWWALALVGFPVPFVVTLLFGALISATDPVAVLALFKEFGAPRRLSLIFEGESIFNDGTAVALFLVVLGIATAGFHGVVSIGEGLVSFTLMVLGGIAMGLLLGGLFAKLVGYARENEFVSITLTIVLAHLTFIVTELISQHLVVGGFHIHLSAIIATTVASLVLGNYGRAKISPHAEEFIDKFWGQFAFLVNSLVFIMVGLVFSTLPFTLSQFLVPIALAVIIVAVGRALSIYPVIGILNRARWEPHIPTAWSHLLAWGSLRGALAITMVLLIPETLTLPGWEYAFTVREFILALTIGCIFATLFIKATTIRWLMDRLHVNDFTELEKAEHDEARALVHFKVLTRMKDFAHKGYIEAPIADQLIDEYTRKFEASCESCRGHLRESTATLTDRMLRLFAIGIEKRYLRELYAYGEVTEPVYKRILGKLKIQSETLDHGSLNADDSLSEDHKDIFEKLARMVRRVISPRRIHETPEEQYMYYRAQSIIARKVLKEFRELDSLGEKAAFDIAALDRTRDLYDAYREQAKKKMDTVADTHPQVIRTVSEHLARQGAHKVEETTLHELFERELITPKIYVTMRDALAAEHVQ